MTSRTLILTVFLSALPQVLAAQYFGQNKVQYRHLKFSVIETEHFDVHYHEGLHGAAMDAARMAERAYARLSRVLNHRYRERQPIILFGSHSEFQQNNVTDVGEGTGGVTDAFRHRVMLPFTGSYASFEHVLQHELVHQFQFDVFARGRVGAGIQRLIAVQPPLWLMEGMAEYLSLGPITPNTAMWLRNAALEGHLPTIEQMNRSPNIFPYRYGHALLSFIGERWGDEAIGQILHNVASSGVEAGIRRSLGMSTEDLSAEWHLAVRRAYLPQIANLKHAREIGRLSVSRRTTGGRIHLAPAVSPDGRQVAYFSEAGSFFVDLYVADVESGRVQGRLVRSAFRTDFEDLRYLSSAAAWSPNGRYIAIAAKHGARDDLVILDARRRRVERRIAIPLDGISTPSWSPDGTQLVFAGFDGGHTDLFMVQADGSGLERLTRDRYATLHPAWSPDGSRIAFATDRGPNTDFSNLRFGPLNIAVYDIATGGVDLLDHMEGNNINPQWAPDGRSLAFVSTRTGIPNVFLYDLDDRDVYQLTNVFTGVSGITETSPAISWAGPADRLVFTYYEGPDFTFNVYSLHAPRSLKRTPYQPADAPPPIAVLTPTTDGDPHDISALPLPTGHATSTASVYRFEGGFRASAATPDPAEPERRQVSVRALLDSVTLALPDTITFQVRPYTGRLAADYIAQPSVGYARDNFGQGLFGGAAIWLSDLLGNKRMVIAGQLNGRVDEAYLFVAYGNLSRRTNWVTGVEQYPLFFFSGSFLGEDSLGTPLSVLSLDRFVVRQGFVQAARPFNRFRRVEFGVRAVNIGQARQEFVEEWVPGIGWVFREIRTRGLGHVNFVQPSAALVFDNSISLYTGPYLGRRSRFEYAPAFGDWRYHQFLADYRRYDGLVGPFVLATRGLFMGRFGRDEGQFPLFMGFPELLRGYTSGSLRRNECQTDTEGSLSGCAALDQLIGTRIAVFNAELRFPLFRAVVLGFLPVWFPPMEGAVFFDAGLAWRAESEVKWRRDPGDNLDMVRQPLASWGFSGRVNLLGFAILRFDYAVPLSRPEQGAYWTISFGPTF